MEKIQDTSIIRKGDYLKVLSNQPAYHFCTCYGGMDIRKEDVEPEELTCIVNSVIDERTCYVTTLLPHEGSNFIADISEIIGQVAPESLPERARNFKHADWLTPPSYVYYPQSMSGNSPVRLARKAVRELFPGKQIVSATKRKTSLFSTEMMLSQIEFALNLVDKGCESYAALHDKSIELSEWIKQQRFKQYDSVEIGIKGEEEPAEEFMRESYKELGMTDEEFENLRLTPVYNWFIAISKDRKEVIICPDIKERTQFARSLGPEYIYAEDAVDHFRSECYQAMEA